VKALHALLTLATCLPPIANNAAARRAATGATSETHRAVSEAFDVIVDLRLCDGPAALQAQMESDDLQEPGERINSAQEFKTYF
jgi:hypothetical protein